MTKHITAKIFLMTLVFFGAFLLTAPTVVLASDHEPYNIGGPACQQYPDAAGCPKEGGDPTELIARAAVILAMVGGVVAVFAVIYGGLQFVTSNGDSAKAAKGRQIVLYAVIGMVVVVIAPGLIAFFASKL